MNDDDEDYDLDLNYSVALHPALWHVIIIGGVIIWSAICGLIVGLLN